MQLIPDNEINHVYCYQNCFVHSQFTALTHVKNNLLLLSSINLITFLFVLGLFLHYYCKLCSFFVDTTESNIFFVNSNVVLL